MKRTKLLFSIMLSLVILLGLGCVTAFAKEYGVFVRIGTDSPISINSENEDSIALGDNCTAVYDAEKNLLTITGNVDLDVAITGNGSTDVVIEGKTDNPVVGSLAISGVKDVTVTATTSKPIVSGSTAIDCSGDVLIQNNGTGSAIGSGFAVTGDNNVTVLSKSGDPTVAGNVAISCEGDITIKNSGTGLAVNGKLRVTNANDVTVEATTGGAPTIGGMRVEVEEDNYYYIGAEINCDGDVLIKNSGTGHAVNGKLTVTNANDVTVEATTGGAPTISDSAEIDCEGDITIKNSGTGQAVFGCLTVTNANDVTVEATTSGSAAINGIEIDESTYKGAVINCSGDVLIKNNVPTGSPYSGYAVQGMFTITSADNVTVESKSGAPTIQGDTEIDCDGDITIKNSGSNYAVDGKLTVTNANDVTVEATTNGPPTISGDAVINCDGDVLIENKTQSGSNYAGSAVSRSLKVTKANNVTVKTEGAQSSAPTISGDAEISCDGDILIKNGKGNLAVSGNLTVTSTKDVTVENVTVEATTGGAPTIIGNAEIDCNGNVLIKNNVPTGSPYSGFAVQGMFNIINAENVTVEVNSTTPALTSGATINCSGNISITNKGGMAFTDSLTVTSANDVRISANIDGSAIVGDLDISCDGRVEIENSGGTRLFSESLNYTQKDGKAFTVETGESFSALEFFDSGTKTVSYSSEEIAGKKAFRITPEGYFKNIEIIYGTADCETAAKGNEVTITADSKSGYTFDKWIVVEGDVELDDEYDSTTTFVVGNSDVVIEATYEKKGSSFGLEEITGDKKKEDKEDKEDIKDNIVDETEETTIILTIGNRMAVVNGEYVENDVAPVIRNSRTMLPVRFVAEAIGADVAWDEIAQKVTITKDDTVIEIYINQPFAFVNNEAIELDSPAFIENGRTYLPIRFITENLGAEVEWDAVSQKVIIKY